MSDEAPHLLRLTRLLEQRQAPVLPVLSAVTVSGTSAVYLAISTRTRRVDLLIPFHPDALAAVAPQIPTPAIPARAMLRISIDGDRLGAALQIAGAPTARAAVDELAEPGMRDMWFAIVDAMPALGQGVINGRTRFLTDERSAIAVSYPGRDPDAEAHLVAGLDALAAQLGLSEPQRTLWKALHASFGSQTGVAITTQCTPAGLAPYLGCLYAATAWDQAVTLTTMIVDTAAARAVAADLGTLAGTLEADELRGIEVVFGAEPLPDVVVWVVLRPA
ncbi:MAG: hypothetical protein NT062_17385 [Proteobacteria bacterium]|nr:hypothetical protein [Pseudomonadota bacterium]